MTFSEAVICMACSLLCPPEVFVHYPVLSNRLIFVFFFCYQYSMRRKYSHAFCLGYHTRKGIHCLMHSFLSTMSFLFMAKNCQIWLSPRPGLLAWSATWIIMETKTVLPPVTRGKRLEYSFDLCTEMVILFKLILSNRIYLCLAEYILGRVLYQFVVLSLPNVAFF